MLRIGVWMDIMGKSWSMLLPVVCFPLPSVGQCTGQSASHKGTVWDSFPLSPSDHLALHNLLYSVSKVKGGAPWLCLQPLPSWWTKNWIELWGPREPTTSQSWFTGACQWGMKQRIGSLSLWPAENSEILVEAQGRGVLEYRGWNTGDGEDHFCYPEVFLAEVHWSLA